MVGDVLCGCKGCATARKPLQDAIARVRELHKDNGWGECSECWEGDDPAYPVELPCPTIKALDGES